VSDTRQQRIEVLKTAARRKSEEKTRSADAAIARLIKRGEPVTFQAVQREADLPRDPRQQHSTPSTHRTPTAPAPTGTRFDLYRRRGRQQYRRAHRRDRETESPARRRGPHSARHSNKLTVKTSSSADGCSVDSRHSNRKQKQTGIR
jgi:hypothetical protein